MYLRSLRTPLHWVQAPLRRRALWVQFRGVGDTETLDEILSEWVKGFHAIIYIVHKGNN